MALHSFFSLTFLLFFIVTCGLCEESLDINDVVSDSIIPAERQLDIVASKSDMDQLKEQLEQIQLDLQRIKLSLFVNQNEEKLDLRLVKCAQELSRSNELGAVKHWEDLQIYLATYDQAKSIATRLLQRVELLQKENVMPVIHFMDFMNVPQAYDTLTRKLKENNHFYGTHEPFLLAENIRKKCGRNQTVFLNLPDVLRHISSSTVALKNKGNGGFLYFQSQPRNVYSWFSPHKHRNDFREIPDENKERGEWTFMLPTLGDRVKIINGFSKTPLGGPNTLFSLELMNDEEIRLRVAESEDTKIVGKYLVGKGRNRGEQFSQILFADPEEVTILEESMRWTAESVILKPQPAKLQRC